ncbi:MAG: hypothetical protein KatS3mg085_569 [Candidatus Dojkabacteria bacterium]|nr:MAG: hypothetical protein KatS3mg085_569 [Candidatus Dojkabacteria bacterium]
MKNLKLKHVSFYIFVLFTFAIFLYSLPTINLSLFGKNYTLFNWDLNSILHNSSPLGNIRMGSGFTNNNVYVVEYSNLSSDEFNEIVDIIRLRAKLAGFYHIDIDGFYNENTSKIFFTIPSFDDNQSIIVEWLTKAGKFEFYTQNSQGEESFSGLDSSDIENGLSLKFDDVYGEHLEFKFTEKAFSNFNLILTQGNVSSVVLKIDGQDEYALIPVTQQTSQGVQITNKFKLVSITTNDITKQNITANLTKSLLLTKELNSQNETYTPLGEISSFYKVERFRYFVITAFLTLVLANLLNFKNFDKKNKFLFLVITTFLISLNLVLLKLVAATVSIVGLITMVLISLVFILITKELLKIELSEDFKKFLQKIFVFNILILYLNFSLFGSLSYSNDAVGVLVTSFIVMFIFLYFFYSSVKSFLYEK